MFLKFIKYKCLESLVEIKERANKNVCMKWFFFVTRSIDESDKIAKKN